MGTFTIWVYNPRILTTLANIKRNFRTDDNYAVAQSAVIIILGMQTLRVAFPISIWYRSSSAFLLLPILVVSFLTPVVLLTLNIKRASIVIIAGLAITRLLEVLVRNASIDLNLSLIGSALFSLSLPILLRIRSSRGTNLKPGSWAGGVIIGLAIDTAIRGLFWTNSLGSSHRLIAILLQVSLSVLALTLLRTNPSLDEGEPLDRSWSSAMLLVIFGPFLLLQILFLQNQGYISEVLDIGLPVAFIITSLGNLAAILGLYVGRVHPQTPRSIGALAAITLTASIVLLDQTGTFLLICIVLVQFIFGWWLSRISVAGKTSNIKYHIRTSSVLGLGQFLFVLILLLSFDKLIFRVELPNNAVMIVLALILGSAIYLAHKISTNANIAPSKDTSLILVMLVVFMTAPIHWAFQTSAGSIDVTPTLPVSVMTYNIHSAVSNFRGQDLESIAQVIESGGADIVAIQEISRGWLMSGGIDIVAWLGDRLEMEAVFSGTANKLWGVAILSKYPIVESGSGSLPKLDSFIPRGFIWAKVDIGTQQPLFIINTHLHHISDEQDVRLAQVPILLALWDNAATTILLGDMNAKPGTVEMGMIANTGFIDSWAEAGVGDEYTLPAHDATVRVDWIWHTKDLISLETKVLSTTASDHLPVVAIIIQAEQ